MDRQVTFLRGSTDDCGNSSSTGVIATIFADGHASLSDIADVSEYRQSPLSGNSIGLTLCGMSVMHWFYSGL
jgi:hypothetical protein